jgi:hypothetical protein
LTRYGWGGFDVEGFIIAVIFGVILFGILGSWVSVQKNRDGSEGFLLGCLFGPLGVLIAALVPTLPKPAATQLSKPSSEREPTPEEKEAARREADELRDELNAEREVHEQFLQRAREREERARLRRQRWEARWQRFSELPQRWVARWQRFSELPEGVRIAVYVAVGIAAMLAVFAIAIILSGRHGR